MSVVRTLASTEGREATASEEAHAERFVQKLFEKHGLSIPIEVVTREHAVEDVTNKRITTYHCDPKSWVKFMLEEELSKGAGPEAYFRSFWEVYRLSHPEHELFQDARNLDPSRVLPLYLHGDEGRSQKKTSYLVVSMESPISLNTKACYKRACICESELAGMQHLPTFGEEKPDLLPPSARGPLDDMWTNFSGHSFLTRRLLFGLGGWVAKKNPHVAESLLAEIAQSFRDLFLSGIDIRGRRFFAALAGVKGDMDFHRKYFFLERSYNHVGKSKGPGFICHCCMASVGGEFPFEELSEQPKWLESEFKERPWPADQVPALSTIPFDARFPEKMIVADPFHVVKLGVARDLIGGSIVFLARKGFFDFDGCSKDFVKRLERGFSCFNLWCQVNKEYPRLKGFNKGNLNVKNFLSAPWINSCGSDSMALLKWLCWFLALMIHRPRVPGFGPLLDCMLLTCEAGIKMFRIMNSHRLVLRRPCARLLYVTIMRFLRGYRRLSVSVLELRIRAFMFKPKTHTLHHMAVAIRTSLIRGHPAAFNPQVASCDINEDFIGRVSRLSRKVNVRCCDMRVIQRVFLKTRSLMKAPFKFQRTSSLVKASK